MKKSFKAKLKGTASGAFIEFPYDTFKLYGKRGLVPVKATFDGVPYQGSLAKMGATCHQLIVRKAIREKIGKQVGDTVSVTVEEDTAPRVLILPEELKALLAQDKKSAAFFKALSYTHQKEYVRWIEEAKRPETRLIRVAKTKAMLTEKKKLR